MDVTKKSENANKILTGCPVDTGLMQRTCNVVPLKTATAFGRHE